MPVESTDAEKAPGQVTGVVLAGGMSRRYGANKALVDLGGRPLIAHVVGVLNALFGRVLVVANTSSPYRFLGLPIVEDRVKGLGPLGGIHAALVSLDTDWAFVAACDMPCLNADLIRFMLALREGWDVVVPRVEGKLEPLHALYRKTCVPALEAVIAQGRRQVLSFFPQVEVRYVEEEEIRARDPDLCSFLNINRPEEWAHLARHPSEREPG